ncbi:MAG: hypothetical protein AB1630_00305 [bacterium]
MNIVEGLRKVLQEILVPELRVIQDTLKEHSVILKEHSERFEQVDKRFEMLIAEMKETREETNKRFEVVFKELSLVREDLRQINTKLDLSQRLSKLEGVQEEMRREFMERLFGKSMVASG